MTNYPVPSRAALASANWFIDTLPDYVPAPNFESDYDGYLCVAWHGLPDKTLFVSYSRDGNLSYTSMNPDGVREGLIEFYKPKPRTVTFDHWVSEDVFRKGSACNGCLLEGAPRFPGFIKASVTITEILP